MDRVSLRSAFHGEPDNDQEGAEAADRGPDQVTVQIKRGTLELRVPNTMPDDRVISKENVDEFMQLTLELEDGSQLVVLLDSSSDMADTRLIPAAERSRASEG